MVKHDIKSKQYIQGKLTFINKATVIWQKVKKNGETQSFGQSNQAF